MKSVRPDQDLEVSEGASIAPAASVVPPERRSHDLPEIGWRERVDFPEWGVDGVLTKIDTGACLSALHVVDIRPSGDGRVGFRVALDRKLSRLSDEILVPVARETRVRSSNGVVQRRFVVRAPIAVGTYRQTIEVSLVCRKSMRCRMLLGREALSGAFLVDSSRDYILTDPPPKKKKMRRTRSAAPRSMERQTPSGRSSTASGE